LVSQQERRLLMTQVGNSHLTHRAVVTRQGDPLIEDSWTRVLSRHPFQLNPSPRGHRCLVDRSQKPPARPRNVMN
jgi:hypothetical protein